MNSSDDVDYKLVICEKEANQEWDRFVSLLPGAHYEQISGWAVANRMMGWKAIRIIIRNETKIVAGAQISFMTYRMIGKIGLISQGPCIQNQNQHYLAILIAEIKQLIKNYEFLCIAIDVHYLNSNYRGSLTRSGFVKKPYYAPPWVPVNATLILDLSRDETEIWKGVSSGRRRNIQKGLKTKFVLHQGSKEEIKIFHDLMLQMCSRRKANPTHENVDFFFRLWDGFEPKGWLKLFMLEYEGEIVCSLIGFGIGDTFRIWKWGWSGKYTELHLPSAMIWQTIKWAKANEFQYFDFVQVDYDVAIALKESGRLSPKLKQRPFSGPTDFKIRFGGKIIKYPGVYVLFRNDFIKMGFRILIKYVIRVKWFDKTIGNVLRRCLK